MTLVPVMELNRPDCSFVQPQTPGGVESYSIRLPTASTFCLRREWRVGKLEEEVGEIEVGEVEPK